MLFLCLATFHGVSSYKILFWRSAFAHGLTVH